MSSAIDQDRIDASHEQRDNAAYGAKAVGSGNDLLPGVFPREMGPNTLHYLREVVEAGLASDMVERFDRYFAGLHGVKHCYGTPGCTQALHALAMALEFEPGSEIIFSPIGDFGTVAGFLLEGYIPVFADTEPGTAHISGATIEPLINERTRAIVCVHKLGVPCDMQPIMALARHHNLIVIEDVCQAILAQCRGHLAGTLGHAACFSLDAEKTCGSDMGGAVITNDDALAARIVNRASARGAVMEPGFGRVHIHRGYAIRMPQCTAATALANLEILPPQIQNRQATAALLDSLIDDIPGITTYAVPVDRTHTYWMYGFTIEPAKLNRTPDEFAQQLREAGIPGVGTGRYYLLPAAMPFLQEYAECGRYPFSWPATRRYHYAADTTPNARDFLETWVRWPWTEKYTAEHIHRIASIVRRVASSK